MFVRYYNTVADGPWECSSRFTVVPRNQAAFVGSDCVLECAISDPYPVRWKKNSTLIYSGYEFTDTFDRFEIIQEMTGTYNLQIRRAQSSDAGEYECGRIAPTVASAQLVIIGKSPTYLEI